MAMRVPSSGRCLAVVTALAISAATIAHAAPEACPAQIEVEQAARQVPADYQAFDSEQQHSWVNAQFSEGPPNEQAWLAPDSTARKGKSIVNSWRFVSSAAGIWLSCGYTGTSVVISRRLPVTIRVCEVVFDTTFSPPAATRIDCR